VESGNAKKRVTQRSHVWPAIAENLCPMSFALRPNVGIECEPSEFLVGVRGYKVQQEGWCNDGHLYSEHLVVRLNQLWHLVPADLIDIGIAKHPICPKLSLIILWVAQELDAVQATVQQHQPVLAVAESVGHESNTVPCLVFCPLEFKHGCT